VCWGASSATASGLTCVVHDGIGRQPDQSRRRYYAAAPVTKAVSVALDRGWRIGDEVVRRHQIRGPRVMDIHHQQHRRRLETFVLQLKADPDLHVPNLPFIGNSFRANIAPARTIPATNINRAAEKTAETGAIQGCCRIVCAR